MNEFEKITELLMSYVEDGSIKYRETIINGLENAPDALNDVLTGKNFGKQLIKIN